jgi:hypothetical protein
MASKIEAPGGQSARVKEFCLRCLFAAWVRVDKPFVISSLHHEYKLAEGVRIVSDIVLRTMYRNFRFQIQ